MHRSEPAHVFAGEDIFQDPGLPRRIRDVRWPCHNGLGPGQLSLRSDRTHIRITPRSPPRGAIPTAHTPTSSTTAGTEEKSHSTAELSWLSRLLIVIEKVGNKLPHPFWLFLSLAVIVMALSAIFSATGLSAVNPATDETV